MTRLHALVLASMLGGLAFVAGGGAGSGGAPTPTAQATAAPARGTNEPTNPPKEYPTKPSGDPYSDYGY